MADIALPALVTLLLWWSSTGLILFLDSLPPSTYGRSMFGATLLLGLALCGLANTALQDDVVGAYTAFGCALMVWGWLEMAFLMGLVTGIRTRPSDPRSGLGRRFVDAVAAILHHELSLLVAGAAVFGLTWNQPNQVGWWTFALLWGMRASAKLNLFLGVRNLSLELLPPHLRFLGGFLRVRKMNALFPISIVGASAVTALLFQAALAPGATPFTVVGFGLLGTLSALAVLEHVFLMLPLNVQAMWQWIVTARGKQPPAPLTRLADSAPARCPLRPIRGPEETEAT